MKTAVRVAPWARRPTPIDQAPTKLFRASELTSTSTALAMLDSLDDEPDEPEEPEPAERGEASALERTGSDDTTHIPADRPAVAPRRRPRLSAALVVFAVVALAAALWAWARTTPDELAAVAPESAAREDAGDAAAPVAVAPPVVPPRLPDTRVPIGRVRPQPPVVKPAEARPPPASASPATKVSWLKARCLARVPCAAVLVKRKRELLTTELELVRSFPGDVDACVRSCAR